MAYHILAATALAALLAASAVEARSGIITGPPTQDNPASAAALEAKGEAYHRAPDAEQNPAEVDETRALNAEIAARDAEADQIDAANRADYEAALAQHDAILADIENQRDRIALDKAVNAEARAGYMADQQARYDHAMDDWRATAAACRVGDRARCEAGKRPAIQTP